ncbi:MAG: glycosyltransferase family 4 protein [Akkermansiaceae bacterium]
MKREIILVGQTPPPFHGQAIAIQNLLSFDFKDYEFHHVRMAFSESIAEVGGFSFKKIFEVFRIIGLTLKKRMTRGVTRLYYHPAGGDMVPIIRDFLILIVLRPFFKTVIFHYHADGLTDRYRDSSSKIFRWFFRRAYFNADIGIKVSAGSNIDLDLLKTRYGTVVLNSVNPPEEIPEPQPVRTGNKIMFLGSVIESKGVKEIIDALAIVVKSQPDAEAHIVGAYTPEFGEELMNHAAQLGVKDQVFLRGQQTGVDKGRIFAECDVFCFPSFYPKETFGLVVAEAMSYELPVVATRWKGIPEITGEEGCGFLVEVHDVDDLATKLTMVLSDSQLRERYGKTGRARYEETFSLVSLQERIERELGAGLNQEN